MDPLRLDRIVFTSLLAVSIAALTQLLQIDCDKGPALRCLDRPLAVSLACFALSIPGLAANVITLAVNTQADGGREYLELRLPLARWIRKRLNPQWEPPHQREIQKGPFKALRRLAIHIAQVTVLIGMVGLFWHFSYVIALVFLLSSGISYVFAISYIDEFQQRSMNQSRSSTPRTEPESTSRQISGESSSKKVSRDTQERNWISPLVWYLVVSNILLILLLGYLVYSVLLAELS